MLQVDNMTLTLDFACRDFFSLCDIELFYRRLCPLFSGSYSTIHHSSRVRTLPSKSGLVSRRSRISRHTCTGGVEPSRHHLAVLASFLQRLPACPNFSENLPDAVPIHAQIIYHHSYSEPTSTANQLLDAFHVDIAPGRWGPSALGGRFRVLPSFIKPLAPHFLIPVYLLQQSQCWRSFAQLYQKLQVCSLLYAHWLTPWNKDMYIKLYRTKIDGCVELRSLLPRGLRWRRKLNYSLWCQSWNFFDILCIIYI